MKPTKDLIKIKIYLFIYISKKPKSLVGFSFKSNYLLNIARVLTYHKFKFTWHIIIYNCIQTYYILQKYIIANIWILNKFKLINRNQFKEINIFYSKINIGLITISLFNINFIIKSCNKLIKKLLSIINSFLYLSSDDKKKAYLVNITF